MQKFFYSVFVFGALCCTAAAAHYAVVVSKDVQNDVRWKKVADALVKKHQDLSPRTIVFENNVLEVAEQLKSDIPMMTCFVVKPEQAGREFVAKVHALTRSLDDDPYPDTRWGILTGYDAVAALKTAEYSAPLEIRRVAAATGFDLDAFDEGVQWSEGTKNAIRKKEKGQRSVETKDGPDDPCAEMVQMFNDPKTSPDLWFTSGHASERDWMIGYSYKAGFFVHKDGQLLGKPLKGETLPINSPNPKVYLAAGNCLIGHIDKADCMATAYFHTGGVMQMFGYTVPSWFGYGGWGVGEYFIGQPGRFTFNEAFFANQVSLVYCLESYLKQHPGIKLQEPINLQQLMRTDRDLAGLLYDSQTVAFFGDPAWEARTMEGKLPWQQKLTVAQNTYTLTIVSDKEQSPQKITGESQPWKEPRAIVQWLPKHLKNVRLVSSENCEPVVTENFILIPRGEIVGHMKVVIEGE